MQSPQTYLSDKLGPIFVLINYFIEQDPLSLEDKADSNLNCRLT